MATTTLIHTGSISADQIRDQVDAWLANPIGELLLTTADSDDDLHVIVETTGPAIQIVKHTRRVLDIGLKEAVDLVRLRQFRIPAADLQRYCDQNACTVADVIDEYVALGCRIA